MLRFGLFASLLVLGAALGHAAQQIASPRLSAVTVQWQAALAALASEGLAPGESESERLARLNAASGRYLPDLATSPVPVLLPLDVAAVLRDQANGRADNASNGDDYFAGFRRPHFFFSGPTGYDAAFAIRPAAIAELADIVLADPVEIQISGLALSYELDGPAPEARPVPALESQFPGIRRLVHEGHVRYLFERFGVPYIVAIECFDGRPRPSRLACTQADHIAQRFLAALRIAGGTPQPAASAEPPAVERPQAVSSLFTYHAPGQLYPGSGFRGAPGRADPTVYARLRFPLAEAPASVNSELYPSRYKWRVRAAAADPAYPWRDNFCERRGFVVGQCPAGVGHQGQDIRPASCRAPLGAHLCEPPHDVVAVRDGAILRSPKQEAVYLVINAPNERIRARYLHMDPRKMDEDRLLSGRFVREGETIGQVSNYSQKENGTSYHLHFDLQVATRHGWVYVNPYMSLVVAYEQLIGSRGVQIEDAPASASNGSQGEAAASPKRWRGKRDDAKARAGMPGPINIRDN